MTAELDELDRALIHVLQVNPRISWADASRVMGLSAGALASRWQRLHSEGLAWLSVYPNADGMSYAAAFVELECAQAQRPALAAALCRDPRVVSLEEFAGRRDLLLTVMVPSLAHLSGFLLDDISAMDAVTASRTSVITRTHREGSGWRIGAISDRQEQQIAAQASEFAAVEGQVNRAVAPPDHELITALALDARRSVADLARVLDRPAATVRRQLQRVVAERLVTVRCDVAPEVIGNPVDWSWFARAAPVTKTKVIASIQQISGLRLLASVTGEANLIITVRGTEGSGMAQIEQQIAEHAPGLVPTETMLHLRPHKRMGWLLDRAGRCTGEVVPPAVFGAVS